MKDKQWPRIKEVVNHGKPMIQVDCRINGRGERKYFETKQEAKDEQLRQRVKRANEGDSAFDFPRDVRNDAQAAIKILEPHGVSLRESAIFYDRHHATVRGDKTIQQVIVELLNVKTGAGKSPRYLNDLRVRLNAYAREFGNERIIDVSQVDDWIMALPNSAVTRKNYRAALSVMFGFAVDRKYILQVPISKQSRVTVKHGKPGILRVEECVRLLCACDDDILPSIALGMFAGLRPESEICRLDWSRIDFIKKEIDIEPLATKNTASERFVVMQDNLIEWLLPHRKAKGPVWPMGSHAFYNRIEKARKAAGIETWPHDCLRHSYCSYGYEKIPNIEKQAGHSNSTTFFRHYRARVQSSDADRYWDIRPHPLDEKVVPISAA